MAAYNNYTKELQFRSLQATSDDYLVKTWRKGAVKEVKASDLCVGDIVQLDTGSQIPAGA